MCITIKDPLDTITYVRIYQNVLFYVVSIIEAVSNEGWASMEGNHIYNTGQYRDQIDSGVTAGLESVI